MATLSALYLATDDLAGVCEALRAWTEVSAAPVETGRLDDDGSFYAGDDFFDTFASEPRAFAVGAQEAGWVTAHVGAFGGVGALADRLSSRLGVRVVVGQGQTTAEAWRISVHEEGRAIRHLEFADGDWVSREGEPLPFEAEPLGTNIAEPGEAPFYDFGFDDAAAYCEALGFRFWSDRQPEDGWLWIRGAAEPAGERGSEPGAGGVRRPWWRRLLGL